MVRAWFVDNSSEDQRLPHMTDPVQWVSLEDLKTIGVEYFNFDAKTHENNKDFQELKKSRGYTYSDVITVSKDTLPNYEEKIKNFYCEHLHRDEEIRYFLEGTGYFDVRDAQDRWVRMELSANELAVLPAGIYHRFTLDTNNYCKVMRLFIGEPVWTPYNRPSDEMQERQKYVKKFIKPLESCKTKARQPTTILKDRANEIFM